MQIRHPERGLAGAGSARRSNVLPASRTKVRIQEGSVQKDQVQKASMKRSEIYDRIRSHSAAWDIVVVGGGATGVGVAIDAAARGYDVLLLEQSDFGKGTSSRSTKLVHGGVRYLEQGNLSLVMEALRERGLLLRNAPHLVHDLQFLVPRYQWWEGFFYGLGLKLYN